MNIASWVFLSFTVLSGIDTVNMGMHECPESIGSSYLGDSGRKGLITVLKSCSKITHTVQTCQQPLKHLTNFSQIRRLYSLMEMSKNFLDVSLLASESHSVHPSHEPLHFAARYICSPDTFLILFIFLSTKEEAKVSQKKRICLEKTHTNIRITNHVVLQEL